MKLQIRNILLFILVTSSFIGCDSYLDTTPKDSISDKLVWQSEKNIRLYTNTFYGFIDRYGQFGADQFAGNMTEGLTETLKYGSYVPGSKAGDSNMYLFTPEMMSISGNLLGTWRKTYDRIVRVNKFLDGLGQFSSLADDKNRLFEGEVRFFRAFLYFQLAKRHGGVILYRDMNLQKDINRSSEEETWDLIAEDLDFAASVLPEAWGAEGRGRITKGAAYAFKSRAMLYAKRWEEAKEAADKVFGLGLYTLTAQYAEAWKGNNSESILQSEYAAKGPNHRFDRFYVPYGEVENEGGSGTPTQEMVESYESKDGGQINWDAWHKTDGTIEVPPYADLEPRFQATVIYPGSLWKGKVMDNAVEGENGRYMGYREDTYAKGRTTTGYYLRKLMDENLVDLLNYESTQTWVEIRLAEVYLNRAEALYNLGKNGQALEDLNKLRERVELPNLVGLSGENLFEAIRQERKIELAYEGHLYWDMRRWKLAHIAYNGYRTHGLKVEKTGETVTYKYVDCDLQDRKFLEKTYVLPIPYSELSNNSKIEQYDEWK